MSLLLLLNIKKGRVVEVVVVWRNDPLYSFLQYGDVGSEARRGEARQEVGYIVITAINMNKKRLCFMNDAISSS